MATPFHSDGIQLQQIDELPCLRIQHPRASALIALQGAQLLEYTPAGAQPVIWASAHAAFKQGQSVRGGIPVCWPWFGDLRKNPVAVQNTIGADNAPAHGWVRNQPWLVEQATCDDSGAHIRLRYPTPTGINTPWAHQVTLTLELHIGSELHLQLTTTHHGSQPLVLSQALHSYFAVSHIDNIKVLDLEQVRFIDTLQHWHESSSPDPLAITQEVDRIYLNTPDTLRIQDAGWKRQIHIQCSQSRSAIVWNPWIEKAKCLSHFADDDYQRMLCIETGRVMEDCIALAPGQTDTMIVRLWQTPT